MYCVHCGKEINENAVICPNCGVPTDKYYASNKKSDNNGLQTAAKIFLIISCVGIGLLFLIGFIVLMAVGILFHAGAIGCASFLYLIPLAWCLPMTIHYCKATKNNEIVGIGFKVCTLLFVNLIAGILMLCDN